MTWTSVSRCFLHVVLLLFSSLTKMSSAKLGITAPPQRGASLRYPSAVSHCAAAARGLTAPPQRGVSLGLRSEDPRCGAVRHLAGRGLTVPPQRGISLRGRCEGSQCATQRRSSLRQPNEGPHCASAAVTSSCLFFQCCGVPIEVSSDDSSYSCECKLI